MELHDYLSKGNDLTKVAILLGLAACKRGTMDASTYVILGIHLEGLLPSTSTEINVSPIVKVAAILSLGLLFQGTGQSYVAEVMLNEIGRPPGPEMEHYIDRESYALSAGLAFGMVALGRGNEMMSVLSLDGVSIPDQLNNYMIGVHKKLSVIQKEKNKTPSYHIREGDCINADVTSPGATLALGMMFFDTHNTSIAEWLTVPDTQNLLETVRPDFILLRVLAKNLILWRDIRPTIEWIESHIPAIIHQNAFQKVLNTANLPSGVIHDDIDYETMTQSYCNIIAGACFALALRYAGSADKDAFAVVHKYTIKLVTLNQKGSSAHIEQAGRSTIESCLNVLIGEAFRDILSILTRFSSFMLDYNGRNRKRRSDANLPLFALTNQSRPCTVRVFYGHSHGTWTAFSRWLQDYPEQFSPIGGRANLCLLSQVSNAYSGQSLSSSSIPTSVCSGHRTSTPGSSVHRNRSASVCHNPLLVSEFGGNCGKASPLFTARAKHPTSRVSRRRKLLENFV